MTPAFMEFKLLGDIESNVLGNSVEENEARGSYHAHIKSVFTGFR